MRHFIQGGPLCHTMLMKVINSQRQKVLSEFLSLLPWVQRSLLMLQLPEWLPSLEFLQMVHLSHATHQQNVFLKCPHEIMFIISKLSQLHMFGRWQSETMFKKITLLKSYFPFNYLVKFINTFCCWWNDPTLTFPFIIAVLLMRPQKMEMRPINMLRVKVRNRNSVCTLWVMFRYR